MDRPYPRTRAPRKYRISQVYTAPDMAHASVYAAIAIAGGTIDLIELTAGISPAITSEQIAAAIRSLESAGMIETVTKITGARQNDGRIRTFEQTLYRLGPKAVGHA